MKITMWSVHGAQQALATAIGVFAIWTRPPHAARPDLWLAAPNMIAHL